MADGQRHWIATEAVIIHTVAVPPVPRRKWQSMLPWLLEDRLLQPVVQLVLVSSERDGSGQVAVLAADAGQLAAWQRAYPGELVPDGFALPWRVGECALWLDGDRWLVRHGPWQLAAGPATLLTPLVSGLLAQHQLQLVVYGRQREGELPESLAALAEWRDPHGLFDGPRQPSLSFVPGADPRQRAAPPRGALVAAGLAALAGVLFAVGSWLESGRIDAQAIALEDQLRVLYQQQLGEPYDFPMADFQALVSRQLGGGAPGPGLQLAAAVAPAISNCGGCAIEEFTLADDSLALTLSGALAAQLPTQGPGWQAGLVADGSRWQYHITPVAP